MATEADVLRDIRSVVVVLAGFRKGFGVVKPYLLALHLPYCLEGRLSSFAAEGISRSAGRLS